MTIPNCVGRRRFRDKTRNRLIDINQFRHLREPAAREAAAELARDGVAVPSCRCQHLAPFPATKPTSTSPSIGRETTASGCGRRRLDRVQKLTARPQLKFQIYIYIGLDRKPLRLMSTSATFAFLLDHQVLCLRTCRAHTSPSAPCRCQVSRLLPRIRRPR